MPWIKVSNWCTKTSCPGITPKYNITESKSFMESHVKKQNFYGTGSMVGYLVWDDFCFDNNNDNYCFNNPLQFVAAYQSTPAFGDFQGLIGLAPNSFKGANAVTPFLRQMENEDKTTLFSIFYCLDTRI
jgi:hypothetical protein